MNDGDRLAFTVATVWREERVSCPHPDILKAFLAGSLDAGARGFLAFHLQESQCPYCNAAIADLEAGERDAGGEELEGLRERLLRSTVAALRGA